ncbi:thermonuclease family protein [Castellaniella sp. GW247-6E4]|uniref:thermonuclease family protein n=1 Tax=Castellaniella sp. GW247-6E4 TaxID=3140380 RepID=UPI003314C537
MRIRSRGPVGRKIRWRAAGWLLAVAFAVGLGATAFGLGVEGATPAQTYSLTGRVVSVSDGDTLTLLVGRARERIRLASIDAPETSHGRDRPGQPFGQAARKALAEQIAGGTYTLACYERDRYERHVCDLPLGGGETASRRLVAAGMAWANMQGGGKYMRDAVLPGLQDKARAQRLGLWARPDAVAPWEWRWRCWAALESGAATPIC